MNPEERKIEATLLSERWKLIGSGIDKRDIKLRGSKLLVKDKKHGEAVNSKFVPELPVNSNPPVVVQPPTRVNSKGISALSRIFLSVFVIT